MTSFLSQFLSSIFQKFDNVRQAIASTYLLTSTTRRFMVQALGKSQVLGLFSIYIILFYLGHARTVSYVSYQYFQFQLVA